MFTQKTLLFCLVEGRFIFPTVTHPAVKSSTALSWISWNQGSLILFGTLPLRWVTGKSWHSIAAGQNQSIRSFAYTLMRTVAQAQRNSSVVSSRGDTWDKVTLNYRSTHQSLPLEPVSHLFIGLSLQQSTPCKSVLSLTFCWAMESSFH